MRRLDTSPAMATKPNSPSSISRTSALISPTAKMRSSPNDMPRLPVTECGECVLHEHGDGHRPHTAGNGCDERTARRHRVKVHVTHDAIALRCRRSVVTEGLSDLS